MKLFETSENDFWASKSHYSLPMGQAPKLVSWHPEGPQDYLQKTTCTCT